MEHRQPVLEYSESDLEVPEPVRMDFRLGDLVALRSSVRFEKREQKIDLMKAARQVGKTYLVQRLYDSLLNEPELEDVGIVVRMLESDRDYIDILWSRKSEITYNSVSELAIIQRA